MSYGRLLYAKSFRNHKISSCQFAGKRNSLYYARILQGLGTVFTIVLVQISLQFFNEANQDLDNLMTLLKAKDRFERKIDISS